MSKIEEYIRQNEGCRLEVYLDTRGIPTCGYGHALHVGSEVPCYVAEAFFREDTRRGWEAYRKLGLELTEPRQAVIQDMLYNLGYRGVLGFKKMLTALRQEDYWATAAQIRDSKYWRDRDTHGRAERNARMMETGKWLT